MIWNFILKLITKERVIWIILLAVALVAAFLAFNSYTKYESKYNDAVANNKAFALQLDKEKAQSNVFKLTVDQLNYYNDSITNKLNEARKELGIKDKQLEQLEYISTQVSKPDTLVLKDTIFKDKEFVLDTTLGDKWVNTKLHLQYPGIIGVEPTVNSEKTIVLYSSRETVNPPKKFFLCRWFQKKHTVVKAVVKENNPYVVNQENVFIEIMK